MPVYFEHVDGATRTAGMAVACSRMCFCLAQGIPKGVAQHSRHAGLALGHSPGSASSAGIAAAC